MHRCSRIASVSIRALVAWLLLVSVPHLAADDQRGTASRESHAANQPADHAVEPFDYGRFIGSTLDLSGRATYPERLRLLPGFQAELVYAVPLSTQGSWVCLTIDDQGRLIASDENRGLYRLTFPPVDESMTKPKVERLNVNLFGAQGLLFTQGALYAVVNRNINPPGLFRLRDTDGDDQFDHVEQLVSVDGDMEHGSHAVILGPDGNSLYLVGGNQDFPKSERTHSLVPEVWQEDRLLRQMDLSDGPWDEKHRLGGWICKTDLNGRRLELVAIGLRNPYDLAFNREGELFTADGDMELDVGTPWYRPCRINHVISGADFGWRGGTSKWPDHYFDSFGSVVDIGLGSPTGVTFGYGSRFPKKYQEALFVGDWSLGNIYAVHLSPDGSSYSAEVEPFVVGAPLPVSDMVIHPHDGAMYFSVGGRGVTSAVYRVTYAGPIGDSGNEPDFSGRGSEQDETEANRLRQVRRNLERHHEALQPARPNDVWPSLSSPDRAIRYAARVALEHIPLEQWKSRALGEQDPRTAIAAMLALARTGEPESVQHGLVNLAKFEWEALAAPDQLDLLRTCVVILCRHGRSGQTAPAIRGQVLELLNHRFPTHSPRQDALLGEILGFLNAPGAIDRLLDLLERSPTQEEQIHYVLCQKEVSTGWTLDQRRRLWGWFREGGTQRGSWLFGDHVAAIRAALRAELSNREQEELADLLQVPPRADPVMKLKSRPLVRNWTVQEFESLTNDDLDRADRERGRELFRIALCYRCHRFEGQGAIVGPDLTHAGRRFNARDLLEAILDPSKVIPDSYRAVQVVTSDGQVVAGKIRDQYGNYLVLLNDPLDPSQLSMIPKDRVEEVRWSPTSTMPQGLLDTLSRDEVIELLAFLLQREPEEK